MKRLLPQIIMRNHQNKLTTDIKNDVYECEGVFALALIVFLKV